MLEKKKMLLHVCCGPCATVALERLSADYDIHCFFYNPNIQPESEYDRRLASLKVLLGVAGVPYIEGFYDSGCFLKKVEGHECDPEGGRRCEICFEYRLGRTAEIAAKQGFDCIASTLSTSPHKNAGKLNEIGSAVVASRGVEFVPTDFKKQDGYKRSIELSKQHDLYRQEYCGCLFSVREKGL